MNFLYHICSHHGEVHHESFEDLEMALQVLHRLASQTSEDLLRIEDCRIYSEISRELLEECQNYADAWRRREEIAAEWLGGLSLYIEKRDDFH